MNNNPIPKSTSSPDTTTPYHLVSPMDETSSYHQQQSPYANQNQIKQQQPQQQLLLRGMSQRSQQIISRFPQQETSGFIRAPSPAVASGQPPRFIFTSSNQQTQPQTTHYVQYTQQGQGQHTVVVQQGTNDTFQRMVPIRTLQAVIYKVLCLF